MASSRPDEPAVDHRRGRRRTKAEAVDGFERDAPVSARPAAFDAKPVLCLLDEGFAAHGLAGFGPAHLEDVLAGQLAPEVMIEGHNPVNFRARQVELARKHRNRLFGHIPEGLLNGVQNGHQRPFQGLVIGNDLDRSLLAPWLEAAHRRSSSL